MKRFAIALLGLISLVSAKPTFSYVPLSYANPVPGVYARGATDGVLDDQQATDARFNERVNLVNENSRLALSQVRQPSRRRSSLLVNDYPPTSAPTAPLGPDGRVVDTAEVAVAKVAHEAAHANERLKLASEATRLGDPDGEPDLSETTGNVIMTEAMIGPDGRVQDTPEVAAARAAHEAAHVHERLKLANEAARTSGIVLTHIVGEEGSSVTPLVLGDSVVAALVPAGVDDRLAVAAPEIDRNLREDVKLVGSLAVAGPTLAFGRLIYQGRI